jgi:hypothetical protein
MSEPGNDQRVARRRGGKLLLQYVSLPHEGSGRVCSKNLLQAAGSSTVAGVDADETVARRRSGWPPIGLVTVPRDPTNAQVERPGCRRTLWSFLMIPFMFFRAVPHLGALLRHEAATDTGARTRLPGAELLPAADGDSLGPALAGISGRDPGFSLVATTASVISARAVVNRSRDAFDASLARPVLSDGLWQVFVMVIAARSFHEIRRQERSDIVNTFVVSATRGQLVEELRIRLTLRGERCEVAGANGPVVRGTSGPHTWSEDWTIRRSSTAITRAGGGTLEGRCPQCGAPLQVDSLGSCTHCMSLVVSGGHDWVVWSIEEDPW